MRFSSGAKGILAGCFGAGLLFALGEQGCNKPTGEVPETLSSAASAKYDWMQFGGGPSHSGNNTLETQISQSTAPKLTKLFQVGLPETAEGQPVVLTGVSTSNGVHDVVFVTTRNGYLVAMDAYTGITLWQHQFGATNITMSSPAIDPSRNFVYEVGLDGAIHKVNVRDGSEVTGGGWPELATLKTSVEKDGTALTLATVGATNYLYLGAGGYDGDGGEYEGHLTTVNLNTGAQKVFNAMCSNNTAHLGNNGCASAKSGVWAKAGVTFDALTNRVYMGTGNGTFAPSSFYWGDSILALNPDGSGAGNGNPLDSYTPSNYQTLQNNDKDLGSTNLLILPNNGSKYPHLGMQSGKDQVLRLINLDNMSGQGGPGKVAGEISSTPLATGGEVQNPCATWINPADGSTWVFVVSPSNGINASKLQVDGAGNPSLVNVWHQGGGGGGAHVANNVLYWASNANLHALNPTTGALLWNSTLIGSIHWQTPLVTNGVLYITDSGRKLTAFSVGGAGGETALPRTGWIASASDSGGGAAQNALDGNTATRFSTGKAMAAGMWFQVDMQSAKTFDQVVMDSAGSGNDYARAFQVFVSNDGVNFGSAVASGTGGGSLVASSFPARSARFMRVVLGNPGTATSWWSLAELNVFTNGSSGTGTGGSGGAAGSTGSGGSTGAAGSAGSGGSTGSGGSGGAAAAAINSGGAAVSPFAADVDFAGGGTISHANTIDTSAVTKPAPAAVYQTARTGNFTYTIPGFAAGASHTVRLHMCETFFSTAGSRVFNVSINGAQVLTSYDILAASGAKNRAIAPQFTANANVTGQYVVQFTSVVNNSLVSGIEIN